MSGAPPPPLRPALPLPDAVPAVRARAVPQGPGQGEWDRRQDRQRQPHHFGRQQQPHPQQHPQQHHGSPPQGQQWDRHWQRDRSAGGPGDDPRRNRGGGGERRMYGKDQLLSHYTPTGVRVFPRMGRDRSSSLSSSN